MINKYRQSGMATLLITSEAAHEKRESVSR